jgi:hypothetical protein
VSIERWRRASRHTARVTAERVPRLAGAIYGTILVLAVIAALSEDDEVGPGAVLGAVVATSVVFWLAHIYADVIARRMTGVAESVLRNVRDAAAHEWPLVEASLAPSVPLLLGAVGVFSRSTAVNLALAVGLVDLFIWGYMAGRASSETRVAAVVSALAAVLIGALMVVLKNLLH